MQESISAVFLFWAAFVISAGPFWTVIMATATTTSFAQIYKNFILYLIFGWLPMIVVICLIMNQIDSLDDRVNLVMHFVGAIVIFYMGWKILLSKPGIAGSFDFNWKKMSLLSWTNPKALILIPIGFLGANFTDNIWLNISLFYLIGVPLFLMGVYCWAMIGRLGAKISLTHINKFNALLMASFGFYLLYKGVEML